MYCKNIQAITKLKENEPFDNVTNGATRLNSILNYYPEEIGNLFQEEPFHY